ncbi:GFA family protein [Oceanibacterium hippocampi]|uniref:Glutathione-dependent formaldehyde-activating enzyme n=1 Tax=Oceanibacterium hippocampi TaxID=745714 RepID=A0A1Y5U4T6_9PROT|nr:GFA family protein [Oceanibacterium hippocampi]SLN77249.1 Glutathione-dependent formaldehyde-activating enzyme [Oceanibacterium hippocampi]
MNKAGKIEGGCLCGAIRLEASADALGSNVCHCSLCRRAHSAPAVPWVTVRREGFRFTQGEAKSYRSTPGAVRRFCGDCGQQLTFELARNPGWIDVAALALDDPEAFPPDHQIYLANKLGWMEPLPGMTGYKGPRTGEED